jgi:hypothetical protein
MLELLAGLDIEFCVEPDLPVVLLADVFPAGAQFGSAVADCSVVVGCSEVVGCVLADGCCDVSGLDPAVRVPANTGAAPRSNTAAVGARNFMIGSPWKSRREAALPRETARQHSSECRPADALF